MIRWESAVAAARAARQPIVALESSVFGQGLRSPANREAHDRMCAAVRAAGAVPAVTVVSGGSCRVGVDDATLERFFRGGVEKVSARDIGRVVALGGYGATTVAGTLAICTAAGIPVFATGGIGGVHRDAPYDESADLLELGRSPVIVVCSGAKAILDLPATVERLESCGVSVVGYRTDELPGFFTARSGIRVARVESADAIARAFHADRELGRPGATLVVQPPPASSALDDALVAGAVTEALEAARAARVRGGAVTPFLLGAVERETHGASVRTNIALLEANARLGAEIAVALLRVRAAD
ncbi:MAG: pseudouridine-5'-phosphate glycosidase [Gemmatimonadetes bacterium]|nr:pseudouridine-5'-phosphate glycosidase [Gemmatimonadota bacterium]